MERLVLTIVLLGVLFLIAFPWLFPDIVTQMNKEFIDSIKSCPGC